MWLPPTWSYSSRTTTRELPCSSRMDADTSPLMPAPRTIASTVGDSSLRASATAPPLVLWLARWSPHAAPRIMSPGRDAGPVDGSRPPGHPHAFAQPGERTLDAVVGGCRY